MLGIKNLTLKVARSTHLILDLLDVCSYMWNVKFEKHKKVSFFTDHKHFEFGYNQKEEAYALDDEWIMNEPEMELIRLHKKERHQTFVPSSTPIPPEFLDSKRKTILEFKDGKKEVREDDGKASVKTKQFHSPKAWRGRTIFKILPGGIENRTSVKVRSTASGPKRRGKPDDELIKAPKKEPSKSSGGSPLGEVPTRRKSKKGPISKPVISDPVRAVPQDGDHEEDPFKDLGLLPANDPPPGSGPRQPEPGMEDAAEYEPSDPGGSGQAPQSAPPGGEALEPRRISLPLPGQEVSRSSPAYQRMLEKLRSDVELYKLHVKHYHMSPAQFRRRTSMLGLPGEIYDRYDRIVKSCKICSTSVPSPPRARIAGLRASSFGDLIFVDHAEIHYGMNSYLVLLVIDGATNLLWATALTNLDAPETLGAFRLWIEENNCTPKGIVGDQAFFTDPFMDFHRFHGISPYPCGPRTPWPNRAETAVRLFKRAWVHMAKALTEEGYVDRVTVRQAVKKVVWARNCQLTVSGYSPLEIATGRRPPDLFAVESSTPEQLSAEPPEEDRTMLQLPQGCRSLVRRHSFHSETFSFAKDPKVKSLTLKSNLPEGTSGRLHSLDRYSGEGMPLDPKFVILMTSCLQDQCVSDHRQECLFEDLLEDFDDGSLCALSLRSDRNYDALSAIPTKEEFSALKIDKGRLPKSLQFVSPQRFVTSAPVQALGEIDRLLPGTEMEIHTSTSKQALSLKPSLKSVRVLTLPHMELEFCNVYRGTFGKTLPLLQRHPDAVVIIWNPNDYDHVFFVTQLIPCLQQMKADHWSMIVFWNEGSGSKPSTGPDV